MIPGISDSRRFLLFLKASFVLWNIVEWSGMIFFYFMSIWGGIFLFWEDLPVSVLLPFTQSIKDNFGGREVAYFVSHLFFSQRTNFSLSFSIWPDRQRISPLLLMYESSRSDTSPKLQPMVPLAFKAPFSKLSSPRLYSVHWHFVMNILILGECLYVLLLSPLYTLALFG